MSKSAPHSGIAGVAASLWAAGARLRVRLYETGLLRQERLRASVISIGNISWGGTGKTPFTIWLAGRLQARGLRVSILTRGYGRTSRERVKILPPGTSPKAALADGDEVQLYLRHLNLPIGIASSRHEAGKLLEEKFPVDVHLLDDGFQHLRLARNLDLVLVDAANPWGGSPGFHPSTSECAGDPGWPTLLREGPSSLRRAHAILLTRCELATGTSNNHSALESLQATVRRFNPDAPCFMVRTKILHFADFQGANPLPVKEFVGRRPLAFCALGNPRNFFGMLEGAGIEVIAKKVFPDHHRYNGKDLASLAKMAQENRADCLITTEKDIVNLPSTAASSLPLYWAAIEPAVEDEDRLLNWIWERLHPPSGLLPVVTKSQAGIQQPHFAGGV